MGRSYMNSLSAIKEVKHNILIAYEHRILMKYEALLEKRWDKSFETPERDLKPSKNTQKSQKGLEFQKSITHVSAVVLHNS